MRQIRCSLTSFNTREEGENKTIEGYFAVFNSNYEIAPGMSESIAPGAFDNTLQEDVRALTNHDSRLVLGRTSAGTLELKQDEKGLWGRITINPNDQDALNLYSRVQRGDVNQCSFGFDIISEEYEVLDDDKVHWTIKEVFLYEVSVVTFPAYNETNVTARNRDKESIKQREMETLKEKAKIRLKEVKDGTKGTDA